MTTLLNLLPQMLVEAGCLPSISRPKFGPLSWTTPRLQLASFPPAAGGTSPSGPATSAGSESKLCIPISCQLLAHCRQRLKCDRQKPCKSCMERGLALSCAFSPAGTMTRGSKKEPQDVHARIDELEKLVASLIDERIASANPSSTGVSPTPMHHHVNGHDDAIGALSGPLDRLSLEDDEVTYTNNSHWSSILEGVKILIILKIRPKLGCCCCCCC